ncbi:MAG: primosomal protein N' [Acidobacteria bacterium]|nr:primosomal protein N' [Acidobacteriota bacterium]
MNEFVDVAIPVGVRKTFAYSVPPEFRERIAAGMRVLVPFGRKLVTGYVTGIPDQVRTGEFKIRPVRELLEPESTVPPALAEIALWIARYYFAPPGEVFRALFPAGTQVSGERRISLTPRTEMLLSGGLRPPGLQPQEDALLDILAHEKSLTIKELAARSGLRGANAWIESLSAAKLIQMEMSLERPRVKSKEQLGIRRLDADPESIAGLTAAQQRLCSALGSSKEPLLLQDVLRAAGCTSGIARTLERKGLVEIAPAKIQRVPPELADSMNQVSLTLTPSQKEIVDRILDMIRRRKPERCLIHGVTGSGKTEVYLRLIAEVLKQGDTALFLVPEIGLTPLLSRLVVSRFPNRVSLLHSGMSAGERFDQWNRIREGGASVVVGTRSAVFAPLENLRFIVIDEEQDASYKQDESPCYHAREVAWQRVQQTGGVLLMGSATPSIETYHSSVQKGGISYFHLPERIEARPLPRVTMVDMSEEFRRHGKNTVISVTLQEELEGCMRRGEQAMILLNRRGYSRTLLCRSCGHVFACPDCSVSMTYHQQENRLACHYCGQEREVPSLCANCGGPYIHYAGVGTEQLESILGTLLPKARIARLDRDTARRRGNLRTVLYSFAERELDVLVGTQILAKGHDFPDVTMVGVIAADSGLSFPDFRSAERTFQLLTQVAGRAGRGNAPGRVVIQSFYPDNYALHFAQKQDYGGFHDKEIEFRKLMAYPPFRRLIQIVISDPDSAKASRDAERIAGALKAQFDRMEPASRPHILGPAAAPLEKLRGNYRMQILLKIRPDIDATTLLQDCFAHLESQKIPSKVHIDVDPLSLL